MSNAGQKRKLRFGPKYLRFGFVCISVSASVVSVHVLARALKKEIDRTRSLIINAKNYSILIRFFSN